MSQTALGGTGFIQGHIYAVKEASHGGFYFKCQCAATGTVQHNFEGVHREWCQHISSEQIIQRMADNVQIVLDNTILQDKDVIDLVVAHRLDERALKRRAISEVSNRLRTRTD